MGSAITHERKENTVNGTKKLVVGGAVMGSLMIGGAALVIGAGIARADYTWVTDESADICNSLSLVSDLHDNDWITMQISTLQLSHDIGRAEAVAGIRQAAAGYCPEYLTVAPTH